MSADWLLRGALTKIGDTFDRLTGRRWVPSSSLATSELIERIKKLLDSEAKEVQGKGLVVPHRITLKMQWDKFSTDSEDALTRLEHELLTAAADHINDSLYYTYAPLKVEVKPDYFTEGVKLFVGFDKFSESKPEAELNVTIAGINIDAVPKIETPDPAANEPLFHARFQHKGYPREKDLDFGKENRISIGRAANSGLILDDDSVSKMHAALVVDENGELSVADTGSTNGTFLNGERIPYGKAVRLAKDDKLKFGTVEVALERTVRTVDEDPPDFLSESQIDDLKLKTLDSTGQGDILDDTAKMPENVFTEASRRDGFSEGGSDDPKPFDE